MELGSEPEGHGHHEGTKSAGGIGEIGFEQSLEFQERLVIEADVGEIFSFEIGLLQAELDCVDGEFVIVLDASEALFLGCGDNLPVHDQRSSGVMVERRDSQNRSHPRVFLCATSLRAAKCNLILFWTARPRWPQGPEPPDFYRNKSSLKRFYYSDSHAHKSRLVQV